MKAGETPVQAQVLETYTLGILSIAKSVHKSPLVWSLPGTFEAAYPTCGENAYWGCLSSKHPGTAYSKRIQYSCDRAGCPVCSQSWRWKASKKIAYRIHAVKKILRGAGYHATRPIHVTVNPEPRLWEQFRDPKRYPKLRRKAQRIAKKAGFYGGTIVFHPFRYQCSKCGSHFNFDTKKCSNCGSDHKTRYWSPHWHLLGFGWIINTAQLHRSAGYLVKNHGVRDSVQKTAYYELGHCGLRPEYQAFTWFGVCNGIVLKNRFKAGVPPEIRESDFHCPLCGRRLRRLRWLGSKPPPDEEDFWPASMWEIIDVYPRVEHTEYAGGGVFG